MAIIYWQKQTSDEPLFEDLLWSRPQNKWTAGKLLIIGGNVHGFAAVGEAYNEAADAGVGSARVLLPNALKKITDANLFQGLALQQGNLNVDFTISTPSGSFAQKALAEFLASAGWADGVLLAGDLGRNSETAILLEKFVSKYAGQLTIAKDAADYFTANPAPVLDRASTTLVVSFAQLQKIAASARFTTAFTFDMPLLKLVEMLHQFSTVHPAAIVVKHLDNIFVAYGAQVSSTKLNEDTETWRVKTAAHAAVWQLQSPNKIFEALTTSLVDVR